MNKAFRKIAVALYALFFSISCAMSAYAQNSSQYEICRDTGVAFVFFNGVQTTPEEADIAKEEFRRIHGEKSSSGDEIKYEVLYNYSNGFEDFVETFEQRLHEQDGLLGGRFELFFEALKGDGPWWARIIDAVQSTAGILNGFVDWYRAAAIRNLTALLGSPPTTSNYIEHKTRIDTWVLEGKKLLFVAHSQGNLFANAAYNYALTKTTPSSVKVVHIAPASPLLSGSHTLADLDLVINGLRVVGGVASVTDYIPSFLLRPAGVNGKKDILGHGLLEIYLNQGLSISTVVRGHIDTALGSLEEPPAKATSGFFTATLTWDGDGDVDLHTFEPSGSHVYYYSLVGDSGYLDLDNTDSFGPEHYYASCDSRKLKTGAYQIAIANYSRAKGRMATVQIASWSEGVLGTESVFLGEATGRSPDYIMFNVVVVRNERTGKYSVSLGR